MATAFARDSDLLRSLKHRINPKDPGAFNNLGVLYHTKGMHAEAVDAFLQALALDSRMRTASRNLEIAARAPGACDARLTDLSKRIEVDPDDVEARTEQARLLRLIGRFDEATRKCDSLIAELPDNSAALLERGMLEQRNGDLRRAQRWFERARNAAPNDVMASLHLAEVLYHRGSNEQALYVLDELLERDKSIADAHLLRGFILGDIGKHEAAADAAREAARINPALATLQADLSLDAGNDILPVAVSDNGELARYGLALAFRQRGYMDGARRELERAAEAGEDRRLVEHALAELDLVTGRTEDAVARYSSLLADYDNEPRLWCEHGVALHQSGHIDDAADSYRRALRADPGYSLAYNNLGVALFHLGDALAAREALLRAMELDASMLRPRLNLARWYREQGDLLAAMALLREMTSFRKTDSDAWNELGIVMSSLGKFTEAQSAFVRAIEHNSSHAGARYGLAEVLTKLGDNDGAARETKNALALASLRPESRMQLGIELQTECPEATASIDLLMHTAMTPLSGTVVSDSDIDMLLVETSAIQNVGELTTFERALAEYEEGERYASLGLHGEAAERYQRCCTIIDSGDEQNSNSVELLEKGQVGDARSRCLVGRGHEVVSMLRRRAIVAPDNAEILVLLASAESQASATDGESLGNERALRVLRHVATMSVSSAALMHFAGDAAIALGNTELAMVLYRRALAADPTRPTPRVAIARILRDRKQLLAAQLELTAALAKVPSMRDAQYELAQVHLLRGAFHDSIVLLRTLLNSNPTDIEALVLLGEALFAIENFKDARTALLHARRHDPSHVRATKVEGNVLAALGREREARVRWQEAALL